MIKKHILLFTLIILICSIVRAEPPNWEHIYGTQYSMQLIAQVTFNSELFEGIGNNMVGAFGPGGESDCRAVAIWQGGSPNEYWYFYVVGNENGEEISFKIYDDETDAIYDYTPELTFTNDTIIGSPSEPFEISTLLGIDVNTSNIPSIFRLAQNTPNPFNKVTFINYSLPKSGNVKLQIYNVKGQLIKTLVDDFNTAGNYSVVWNALDLRSGVYFYRIVAGTFIDIKKCIILR